MLAVNTHKDRHLINKLIVNSLTEEVSIRCRGWNRRTRKKLSKHYIRTTRRGMQPSSFEFIGSPMISTRSMLGTMDLAAAFANLVTKPSDKASDWVARNGNESIFSVLWKLLPEVIHALPGCTDQAISRSAYLLIGIFLVQCCHLESRHRPVRGKVSRSELNKVLQSKHGFVCLRSRKKELARLHLQPSHMNPPICFTSHFCETILPGACRKCA